MRKIQNSKIIETVKKNKVLLAGIAAFFLSICFIFFTFDNSKKSLFEHGHVYEVELVDMHDIAYEEGKCRITGEDAFLVYQMPTEFRYMMAQVKYTLASYSEVPNLKIYYADASGAFSEEKSFIINGAERRQVVFLLPKEDLAYVRIDIDQPKGFEMTIDSVKVATRGIRARLGMVFNWYNIAVYAVLFLLCSISIMVVWPQREYLLGIAQRHPRWTVVIVFATVTMIVYGRYLFGGYRYVFTSIMEDSVQQIYPNYLYLADRIEKGAWNSYFNFSQGLGIEVGAVNINLSNWVSLFGRNHVAYLMGVSQWLKVFLSGISAYAFSRTYGNGRKVSLIVGMGYAFCAPMILRGTWISYPNFVLLLMLWLFAYEYAHRNKKIGLLLVVTCVYFYHCSTYDCLLWSVLLLAYILFREIVDFGGKISLNVMCRNVLAYFFAMSLTIGNISTSIQSIISSERFETGKMTAQNNRVIGNLFANPDEIATAFVRTIGLNINGVTEDYVGRWNTLDDPAFYCGIFIFLLLPVSLYNMAGKKRVAYILTCLTALVYIEFVPLRYLMNGMSKRSYKLSSAWIIVFLIIIAMEMLHKIFDERKVKERSGVLFLITAGITAVGLAAVIPMGLVTRPKLWAVSFIFLFIYCALIYKILIKKDSRPVWGYAVCACVALEVMLVSWDGVNDRKSLIERQNPYEDETVEALDYLKQKDDSWHRTEKTYNSVYLCDSLAQGYYGTKSYVGGTGIGNHIIDVYTMLGLPRKEMRSLFGSGGNIYADSLFGVKYVLSNKKIVPNYGYHYLDGQKVSIYENELALPLAYGYSTVITEEEFMKLSILNRSRVMLKSCVLSKKMERMGEDSENREFDIAECAFQNIDGRYKILEPRENDIYVVYVTFGDFISTDVTVSEIEGNAQESFNFGYMYSGDDEGNVLEKIISFHVGETREFELYMEDIKSFWFDSQTQSYIENISVYRQDADKYYQEFKEDVGARKEAALQITAYDNNQIEGYVDYNTDMVLATAIPYNDNWSILIDGKPAETFTVNIGFLGTWVPKGHHEITLCYPNRNWLEGNMIRYAVFLGALMWALYDFIAARRKRIQQG